MKSIRGTVLFFVLFVASSGVTAQNPTHLLLQKPAVSRTQIVFAYAGACGLWAAREDRHRGLRRESG
jgi:hypothetical protein